MNKSCKHCIHYITTSDKTGYCKKDRINIVSSQAELYPKDCEHYNIPIAYIQTSIDFLFEMTRNNINTVNDLIRNQDNLVLKNKTMYSEMESIINGDFVILNK